MTTEMTQVAAPSAVVAEEVRATMARKRGSQTELARRTGKQQQYWSRRIVGEVPFDVNDLAAISAYLEVPVTALVSPLDGMSGGRPPIGRYGDTPGHDTPSAWELAA